jgi:hypothetical protein
MPNHSCVQSVISTADVGSRVSVHAPRIARQLGGQIFHNSRPCSVISYQALWSWKLPCACQFVGRASLDKARKAGLFAVLHTMSLLERLFFSSRGMRGSTWCQVTRNKSAKDGLAVPVLGCRVRMVTSLPSYARSRCSGWSLQGRHR